MNQVKIGALITIIRNEKGFTQKRLADILGVSEETISMWECGSGFPEVSYMVPLCEALGITVKELLTGEAEVEQLKNRVYKQYGFEINHVEVTECGAGSLTYFVSCGKEKYVVKYPIENGMNHIDEEPVICSYLVEKGIPACEFVANLNGNVISIDENGQKYHIQEYIDGRSYEYHTAPRWLITKSAEMLGKIHQVLKSYPRLSDGIGEDFFRYTSIDNTLVNLHNSLQRAMSKCNDKIVHEIRSNIEILERFPQYTFDVSKFTNGNTHGDYMITQLLCGEDRIMGVIDWTSSCVHPLVWEVIRSYLYMSPKCADGEVDLAEFTEYVRTYLRYHQLNRYDLENMGKMFFYFTAVCDFYGQYLDTLTANREIYLKQALFSSKLLRWFDWHIAEVTDAMISIANELDTEEN